MKSILDRIFVDGLGGMAHGLFATLIIGTIIQQIGLFAGGDFGNMLYMAGKMAAAMTGAGIGVGVARKFNADQLVVVSAATVGMIGAFAGKLLAGEVLTDGNVFLAGPGEPLGAFVAAYVAIEDRYSDLREDKTGYFDHTVCVYRSRNGDRTGCGTADLTVYGMAGSLINWGTEQQPFLMGIVVSVLMGMILTLPISSAAIGVILNLSGLAAGAATIGCCWNMVGFAVASFRENGFGGFLAQGIGTSMLQVPNIVRHPKIWLPAILSSAILGPVGTMLLHMTNNATGSGMGTAGLVGQIDDLAGDDTDRSAGGRAFEDSPDPDRLLAVLTFGFSEFMRRKKWIRFGEMKLDL